MIKEVSVIKAFDDYRKAMDYTKTILEDVVLFTMHGENGSKLHGPISKINIQEILSLFLEPPKPPQREWQGLTNKEVMLLVKKWHGSITLASAIEAKLREKNNG
jgi:hypothetical protein